MFAQTSACALGLLAFAASVQAHFQLQYPTPRGVFVEDDEPNFCDGYTDAVDNRTSFPLGEGFITLNSEHPSWTAQVLLSLTEDPTTFDEFNLTAVNFFSASGEGSACIAIDFQNLNLTGITNGTNVTIQIEYDGGDGALFQCADLTLSSDATAPSDVTCSNLVSNSTTNVSTSATSTAESSSSSSTSAALQLVAESTGLLGLVAAGIFSLL